MAYRESIQVMPGGIFPHVQHLGMNRMIEDTASTPTYVPIFLDGRLHMYYMALIIASATFDYLG